ncbi:MAG TPA: phosphoglycerate kinase [Solirubrobacteraceae bacterium]|jgi:phosphoglycerate kinase|nr:phosphoglycerate kinase [Solirubrobacteraceae bacterium]
MRTLDDLDLDGARALVRVDFNVPLGKDAEGSPTVADDTRIRAALETIEELRRAGASIVLVSHLGRPEGRREADLSLAPVVERLRELTDATVMLAPAVVGERVEELAEALEPGELLVLENVRFEPGETSNDPALARALAGLADVYVDDAFGAAHRAHASTEGVAHLLPSAAGRLLEREVRTLGKILEAPPRPLVAVIGGAKVADKIGVIDRFLDLADVVIIGGAMCFPFLCAQGHAVGDSLCGDEDVEHARRALAKATDPGRASVSLPTDLVIGTELSAEAEHRVLAGIEVPEGWMGLDIGPASAERYAEEIAKAGSVFWNGPMGAFELEPYAAGTRRVAQAVAEAPGVTVVGGGDSAAALALFGLEDSVDHLSTGGGATLELVEGRALPGVEALDGAGAGAGVRS